MGRSPRTCTCTSARSSLKKRRNHNPMENHLTETATVLRATEYPQEWDNCSRDHQLTRLAVDHGAHDGGRVTLSAFSSDRESPYGFEFDISPADARRLAGWLTRAATDAE